MYRQQPYSGVCKASSCIRPRVFSHTDCAQLLQDVGVTAYEGAIGAIQNATYVEVAASKSPAGPDLS